MTGLWSGVKDSGPHTVDLIPVVSRAGTRLMAPLMCVLNTSQSNSYRPKAKSRSNCQGGIGMHAILPAKYSVGKINRQFAALQSGLRHYISSKLTSVIMYFKVPIDGTIKKNYKLLKNICSHICGITPPTPRL